MVRVSQLALSKRLSKVYGRGRRQGLGVDLGDFFEIRLVRYRYIYDKNRCTEALGRYKQDHLNQRNAERGNDSKGGTKPPTAKALGYQMN